MSPTSVRLARYAAAFIVALSVVAVAWLVFLSAPSRTGSPSDSAVIWALQFQSTLRDLQVSLARGQMDGRATARDEVEARVRGLLDDVNDQARVLDSHGVLAHVKSSTAGADVLAQMSAFVARGPDLARAAVLGQIDSYLALDELVAPLDANLSALVAELHLREPGRQVPSSERSGIGYLEALFGGLGILAAAYLVYDRLVARQRAQLVREAASRAEVQRTSQARVALLAMVTHELRTPLQTILSSVEMLEMILDDPRARPIIQRLHSSVELISGQLDNISRYTRLANGTMEVRRDRFDVLQLLREIVDQHSVEASAAGQRLQLHSGSRDVLMVHADRIRLHQVVSNYITNAIKYAGPVHIQVGTEAVAHAFGNLKLVEAVEIYVSDEGPGLSSAEADSIWEPFVRGKSSTNTKKGSGLGLAVVKLLASSVGWEVGLRTSPGKGATFFVRLPLTGPDTGTANA